MKSTLKLSLFTLVFASLFFAPTSTEAHEPDHSYLYLRVYEKAMEGRIETSLEDLNQALNLQLDTTLTQESIKQYLPQIQNYLKSKIEFKGGSDSYSIQFKEIDMLWLEDPEEGDFLQFYYELNGVNTIPDNLDIRYEVFLDENPEQRGMLIVESNWKAGIVNNHTMISNIFTQSEKQQQLSLTDRSIWKGIWALIKLGVWHIWIGLDHILFILALILPSVVRRRSEALDMSTVETNVSANYSDSWLPVSRFKPAFWYIIKIITFFTIAHSLTLALAALDIVKLNIQFVESVIAGSIALAALHNIVPIFKQKEWVIALVFGLFHGFGFASVLGEKGLSGDYMVASLLGFNVGVELGQVLIICMMFPFLFLLRKFNIYPKIVKYGSMILILISIYWVIERGLGIDLPAGRFLEALKGG
jgi:hydrogenase/urease accessory protein HupE